MDETETPQPAKEPRKRFRRELHIIAPAIQILPALVIAVRKTGHWPNTILYAVTVGIPFIQIGLRYRNWNRWLSANSLTLIPLEEYMPSWTPRTLTSLLNWIWGLAICLNFGINDPMHHISHAVLLLLWFGIIGCIHFMLWYLMKNRHKFKPCSIPPNKPTHVDISRYKPLYSDHWGERVVPDTAPTD
jgi:hypothetical protein